MCRFHVRRTLTRRQGQDSDWRYDDEEYLEENHRPEWRTVGYQHIPGLDPEIQAYNILADSVRVYCSRHIGAYKNGLRKILEPQRLPGPLCRCNVLDRFVGRWLCVGCFEEENNGRAMIRMKTRCCERECFRPADLTWKQCVLCSMLKEPYQAKGFNVVYRRD